MSSRSASSPPRGALPAGEGVPHSSPAVGDLASATGMEFFRLLVRVLAETTGTDFATVARRVQGTPEQAETLALHAHGQAAPNVTYDLSGTPCEHALAGAPCSWGSDVALSFPRDLLLAEMDIEAYCGVPLFDSGGHAIGLLSVMHCRPRQDLDAIAAVLQSYTARAASELERTLDERALRRREERLTRQNAMLVDLARSPAVERGDRDAFLREITESISRTLELERALVCQLDEALTHMSVADLYLSAVGTHESGASVAVDDCPVYLRALATSRFVDIDDTATDARAQELAERYFLPTDVRSTLDAPIRVGGRLIGMICCESVGVARSWRTDEKLFAASVADLVSLGLEAIDLRAAQREVHSRNRALSALQRISDISLRARTLEEALDEIVDEVADLTRYPAVWLRLATRSTSGSRLVAGHGLFEETGSERVDVDAFPSDQVLVEGDVVVRTPLQAGEREPPGLFVGVPLLQEQRVLGVLCLWDPAGQSADPELLSLLRGLAASVAGLVERSHAREQAEELEDRLRQSQKLEAIGTLAGGVAHDFNNLLTGILGYAWLLKQNAEPESDVYRASSVIENAAERAAELTRQLLGFARQGKHQELAVDLDALVSEVTELLGRTLDKSVAVHVAPSGQPLRILGDPGQLHQVLLNLAINARDAMPHGGDLYFETRELPAAEVPRRAHPQLGPGAHALLQVRDTGCGIRPLDRRRIFEPFFTTKEQGKGSGMGLAMVYGIVQAHRGAIEVESREDVGSTFRLLLPLTGDRRPSLKSERPSDDAQNTATPERGEGLVLVVDDEELVREMAGALLGKLGYQVLLARNGLEAIDRFLEHRSEIRLVLLDLVMPRMGGRECLRALRRIDPKVRVLLSSGWQREGLLQGALDDGALGFLSKPFQLVTLSQAVARALQT